MTRTASKPAGTQVVLLVQRAFECSFGVGPQAEVMKLELWKGKYLELLRRVSVVRPLSFVEGIVALTESSESSIVEFLVGDVVQLLVPVHEAFGKIVQEAQCLVILPTDVLFGV